MNIIGLGSAGCKVADELSQHPQYKIFKIDVGISGDGCYNIPSFEAPEEFEAYKFPKMKTFFKGIVGETTFVVAGGGKASCASLKILQNIKHLPISILYIKPDLEMLNQTQKMQERLVFGVLQEYARSGIFEKICLVSNTVLDSVVGGAPIIGYYDKLNEALVSVFHMINVFYNTDAAIGKIEKPKETHRIVTIGLFDVEKNEEKMFFSLDNSREKCYIYSISEEKLKTDKELFRRLKNQIKLKSKENVNITYAVYSSDYEQDFGYIIERTPHIQLQEVE